MANEDRFKQSVVLTLSRRAANQCSNPACGAITSGPTAAPDDSVNLGEAAHIFGANEGSARFNPEMSSAERSAITNAIWLCSICHKKIDDDPIRYPAGLLFEWQREHESSVSKMLGVPGADARKRYEKRHLQEFGELTYVAERLILEKDDYWEFLLAAEMLRLEISPVSKRWDALKRGLYVKPLTKIERADSIEWIVGKLHEIESIVAAFANIIRTEFERAWGAPGISGSDVEIVFVARLFGEVCRSTLAWEESVRFARIDDTFSELRDLLIGVAGGMIEQAARIPRFLTEIFTRKPTSGSFELVLTISLPDNWEDSVHAALDTARARVIRGQ